MRSLLFVAVAGVCCVSAYDLRPQMAMRGQAAPMPLEPPVSPRFATTKRAGAVNLLAAAESGQPSLLRRCIAEAIGTGIIVKLGCGSVCAAKFAASGTGLFGISVAFGIAVAVAIFAAGPVSGAHLNPAMTIGLVSVGKAPAKEAPFYILAQVAGAIVASAGLYALFESQIAATELAHVIGKKVVERGSAASAATMAGAFAAMPNTSLVSTAAGVLGVEAWATTILAFMISVAIDSAPPGFLPVIIGATVSVLICVIGPLSGACMNPARDLGPRLVAYYAGWGSAAIPFAWSYTLGPVLGALVGFNMHSVCLSKPKAKEA